MVLPHLSDWVSVCESPQCCRLGSDDFDVPADYGHKILRKWKNCLCETTSRLWRNTVLEALGGFWVAKLQSVRITHIWGTRRTAFSKQPPRSFSGWAPSLPWLGRRQESQGHSKMSRRVMRMRNHGQWSSFLNPCFQPTSWKAGLQPHNLQLQPLKPWKGHLNIFKPPKRVTR